jgi:CRISPR-associated protein Csy1
MERSPGNKAAESLHQLTSEALVCIKNNDNHRAKMLLLEILQLRDSDPLAWYYLGVTHLRFDAYADAEHCLRRAITLNDSLDLAHYWLGVALANQDRATDALASFRATVLRNPAHHDAWIRAARLLGETGDFAEAERCARKATEARPASAEAHALLGEMLDYAGRFSEAHAAYSRGLTLDSANLKAALGHYLSLPVAYRDSAHLIEARKCYQEGLQTLAGSVERFKPKLRANDLLWSNFYLAYQGMDDRGLQAEFATFYRNLLGHVIPQFMHPPPSRPVSGRRIRVGYLSHFLHNHAVSFYFRSWIERADRDAFEVFVYHLDPVTDAVSSTVANTCEHYRPVGGSLSRVAQTVRDDALDVLVYPEIGMYPRHHWLAALRLAPIQCAAWGHPVTTGLSSIDYFLSADATEPPGAEAHYTERLVRLPGMGVCVQAPDRPPSATRAEFGLPEDRHVYLCAQSLFKVHPEMDEILAKVATRDPRALIVLFEDGRPHVDAAFRNRIEGVFAKHGLDPAFFLRIQRRFGYDEFLRFLTTADVILDTPHWSGGRTSFDVMACGLPVVTLAGSFSRGRQTAGMLRIAGLGDLIARDADDYVERAIRIGSDRERRERLGKALIASLPIVCGGAEVIRGLESFFRVAVGAKT